MTRVDFYTRQQNSPLFLRKSRYKGGFPNMPTKFFPVLTKIKRKIMRGDVIQREPPIKVLLHYQF
jgi:hypothetical protein